MSILIYQGQSNMDFFEVLNVNLYVNLFLANVPILYRLKTPENQRQKQPPGVFCKKGALRNLAKFTGKHLWQSLSATLLKKRLWRRCFPLNFAKFLRTLFLIEHLPWLILTLDFLKVVFSFMGSPNLQLQLHPFKLPRNCLKEQMLRVLHSICRDCLLNQFRTEKLAE